MKLRLDESTELWRSVKSAAYEIAFDWEPWKCKGAGRFAGLRAAFRAFGPAMQLYALTSNGMGPTPRVATDDLLAEATAARGAALEFK